MVTFVGIEGSFSANNISERGMAGLYRVREKLVGTKRDIEKFRVGNNIPHRPVSTVHPCPRSRGY